MPFATRLTLLAVILAVAPAARAADVRPPDLYVSPDGNDAWTGALPAPNPDKSDGPLASPDAARLRARAIRKAQPDRPAPLVVAFRGGTYALPDTLTLTPDDSGTERSPTVYAAHPGETPVLSAGRRITGWSVDTSGPFKRWRVVLPDVKDGKWSFSQLFVNGQRRNRPRLPKAGYHFIAGRVANPAAAKDPRLGDDRFRFNGEEIRGDWRNLADVEVVTFHPWYTSMFRIAGVDAGQKLVRFTGPTRTSASYGQLKPGLRFLVDNVAEALDAPGEWYLDRPTGELTYLPRPGEEPDQVAVVAPRLERVVQLVPSTDPAAPIKPPGVRHVQFRGLTFAHTNFVVPEKGYSVQQAAVTVTGAVFARGATDCAFAGCTFTQLGTYGLELEAGCKRNRVEGCRFVDLGAGGVKVGTTNLPKDEDARVTANVVRDNTIAHAGRIHPAAVGVWVGQADHTTIEHNDIYDLYYTAVSLGWTWGYGPAAAHHNVVAHNHVHTVGQGVLSDMAFIYTLGASPGTVLTGNHMHGVARVDDGYGGWGIYYDEGTTGVVAERNLVYDTHDGGFHQHYGEDNVVRNNLFGPSRGVQFGPSRIDSPAKQGVVRERPAFTFERNVVHTWGAKSVARTEWFRKLTLGHLDKFVVDRNVYWNNGREVRFGDMTFAQWQAKGLDRNSVIADPVLLDVGKGDYRLGPDSPALRLGFERFDVSKAGRLTPEPADLDPARWPRAFPPPPGPRALSDSFESTPVGQPADGATTSEEHDRATARVSADVAFDGRRSLKVTDAPGQQHKFNPHVYWSPNYRTGTVTARFAVRPEPGATWWHEWRTGGSVYKSGPSFGIKPDGSLHLRRVPKSPLKLPAGQWTAFEITCPLRPTGADGALTYDLAVTLPGQPPRRFPAVPCERGFDELTWFGFTSDGDGTGVFYLDAVHLEAR